MEHNNIKIELGGANTMADGKKNEVKGPPAQMCKKHRLSATKNRREKRERERMKSNFDVENAPRKINADGMSITMRNKIMNSVQYVCSANCKTGCDRQIKINQAGKIMATGSHKESCYYKEGVEAPKEIKSETKDFGEVHTDKMWMRASKLAKETVMSAGDIWDTVNKEVVKMYGPGYQGLRREQVMKLV